MLQRIVFSILFLCATAFPAAGALLTTETRQSTSAGICTDGILGCAGGVSSAVTGASVNSTSHSNISDGGPASQSEARTAARSGSLEIAANASLRHRESGPFENYTEVRSDAIYEWDVVVLNPGNVSFTFNLPPGFVEVQSNAEFQNILNLHADVQANIQFCTPACTYSVFNDLLFQMFAELEANFQTYDLRNSAYSANPALDLEALRHDTVVLADAGFLRTWTWAYESFTGEIPLGHFAAGDTFTISYRLLSTVYADFGGFDTAALAAINDPFFLSSDALPQQDALTFAFSPAAPVPLPAALPLFATALCGLCGYTLRRTRRR